MSRSNASGLINIHMCIPAPAEEMILVPHYGDERNAVWLPLPRCTGGNRTCFRRQRSRAMNDRDFWPPNERRRFWSICLWGFVCIAALLAVWWILLASGAR